MKGFKFILILFLVYLFFALPLLGSPLLTDEAAIVQLLKIRPDFLSLGAGGHPPLYFDFLRLASKLFDIQGGNLRIIGIICFLLNLFLIYNIALLIYKDKNAGIISCLLFSLHPMAIQGSMILDIDNTILAFFSTLTVFYFIKNFSSPNLRNYAFLTLLFFLCLWSKLGTPLILIASIVLFCFLRKDSKKAFKIIIAGILSIVLFALVWKINSMVFDFSFSTIFGRAGSVFRRGMEGVSFGAGQELVLRFLRVSLWFNLYLFCFIIFSFLGRARLILFKKDKINFIDLPIIYSIGILFFYTIIGGLSFGFAKYQYPALPLFSIIASSAILNFRLSDVRRYALILFLVVVLVLVNLLILKDPIYAVNYTLRKLSIFSPPEVRSFVIIFLLKLFFCVGLLIIFARFIQKKIRSDNFLNVLGFFLVFFVLLNSLFFDFYLRKADFFTTYCYGRSIGDFREAAGLCKQIASQKNNAKIIAPEDILYYAGIKVFIGYEELWNNPEKFLKLIRDEKVSAVIYGFTYNSVFSYKNIFLNPQVTGILRDKFVLRDLGEYTIWERK